MRYNSVQDTYDPCWHAHEGTKLGRAPVLVISTKLNMSRTRRARQETHYKTIMYVERLSESPPYEVAYTNRNATHFEVLSSYIVDSAFYCPDVHACRASKCCGWSCIYC